KHSRQKKPRGRAGFEKSDNLLLVAEEEPGVQLVSAEVTGPVSRGARRNMVSEVVQEARAEAGVVATVAEVDVLQFPVYLEPGRQHAAEADAHTVAAVIHGAESRYVDFCGQVSERQDHVNRVRDRMVVADSRLELVQVDS